MKILVLISLLTGSLFAEDLYINFSNFSDDGGKAREATFKVNASAVHKGKELSCRFFDLDMNNTEIKKFTIGHTNDFFFSSISVGSEEGIIGTSASMNKKIDEIFVVSDIGDGYVHETLSFGSTKKFKEYNAVMSSSVGNIQVPAIDLRLAVRLEVNMSVRVTIDGELYEAHCSLNSDD